MSPNATPATDLAARLMAMADSTPDWHPADTPTVGDLAMAATAPPRYHLLDLDELAALPPPTWLLEGMIVKGGFSCLYGPSGGGKSFLALDWGLSVAYGRPWAEHTAQPGPVVYIAGEGTGGLAKRVDAWRAAHGVTGRAPFYTLPDAVNFLDDGAAAAVLAALSARQDVAPALVIVDTLARSMVGGDENGSRDMGVFITNLDRIRHTTGATVLVIHHTGKTGQSERGSSALRAAADTMIALDAEDGVIRLTCDKQKDAPPFDQSTWQLTPYADSCILAPATAGTLAGTGGQRSAKQWSILETLAGPLFSHGARYSELKEASGLTGTSFSRALNALLARGDVRQEGPPHTKDTRYYIAEQGETLVLERAGVASSPDPLAHSFNSSTTVPHSSTTVPTDNWNSDPAQFHSSTVPPPYKGGTGGTVEAGETVNGNQSAGQENQATNGPAPPRYSAPPLSAPPMPTDSRHQCGDLGCEWLWLRTGGWVRTCQDRTHLAGRSFTGGNLR